MLNIQTKVAGIPCHDKGIWTNPETHTFAKMFENIELCEYYFEIIGCFLGHTPHPETDEELRIAVDTLAESIKRTVILDAEDKNIEHSIFAEIINDFISKVNYEEIAFAWIKNGLDPRLS